MHDRHPSRQNSAQRKQHTALVYATAQTGGRSVGQIRSDPSNTYQQQEFNSEASKQQPQYAACSNRNRSWLGTVFYEGRCKLLIPYHHAWKGFNLDATSVRPPNLRRIFQHQAQKCPKRHQRQKEEKCSPGIYNAITAMAVSSSFNCFKLYTPE